MSKNTIIFGSSLGKKFVMSLTGLFLCSFLIVHLGGNIALFTSKDTFNEYTKFMTSNPLIRFMEIILVLGFLTHIVDAILLYIRNKNASNTKYIFDKKKSSISSRSMALTGSFILFFLIVHLRSFWYEYKFGEVIYSEDSNGNQIKDMYHIVTSSFESPMYSLFYVSAVILLGIHLNHGFQSAFLSLGLRHKKYTPFISLIGKLFSFSITLGFISFPIYFCLKNFNLW